MSNLDQLVKGAPAPGTRYDLSSTSPIISIESPSSGSSVSDPLASLPSSPPQIYLNLLILEASLRAQWLQMRARKRQHTFFYGVLGLWILYFGYALFFAPREDGSGVGGSIYWAIEVMEKICLGGGIMTGVLIWGTGQWDRCIRKPRRFVGTTNRGLRGFHCKMVVIRESWWREILSTLSFYFSSGLISSSFGTSYRYVDHALLSETEKTARIGGHHALPNIDEDSQAAGYEEDLAPGGDYIKLLLQPKPFSAMFRENWDIYRTEYWEKENERRAVLRQKLKERERKLAKQEGGWLWWTGYRGWKQAKPHDLEKTHPTRHASHKLGLHEKDQKRIRSSSIRSSSHSRNSSRSSTPGDLEEGAPGHVRRGSNASERRKKTGTGQRVKLTPAGSRSATPEVHSPLIRGNSFTSVSSQESERPGTSGTDEVEVAGKVLRSGGRGSLRKPAPGSLRGPK